MLKGIILGSYKNVCVEKLCKKATTLHGSLFPNSMMLCKVVLCMTLTGVECERTFSTQNRLKSKHRASTLSVSVDILMKISICDPSLKDLNPIKTVQLWYAKKNTGKGRHKVSKGAKIRNRYNQIPHLTQDTNGKVTNSQLYITNETQEVSPFPEGDHKAQINRRAQRHKTQDRKKHKSQEYKARMRPSTGLKGSKSASKVC